MKKRSRGSASGSARHLVLVAVPIGVLAALGAWSVRGIFQKTDSQFSDSGTHTESQESLDANAGNRIHDFCGSCHVFPPADSFPREAWRHEVERGYGFAKDAGQDPKALPPLEQVVRYFEARAPADLRIPDPLPPERGVAKLLFRRHDYSASAMPRLPGVSNVKWVNLNGSAGLDCLVCDMRQGHVFLWRHDQPERGLISLAKLWNPAHVEVVDLDQDGHLDLLVADLGSFLPTDEKCGRVVWLRRIPETDTYKSFVLAKGLGRVADVQAADFDGDGHLNLIVAAFGRHKAGQIVYLENHTTDWAKPDFRPITLEERTGAIHVPVADMNGDGRPDFVAVFSQEHEQVVAFLNVGTGKFRRELIYAAPDPAFGSSGIQLVDLDGDGDLDVLYTNGDSLDSTYVKPYHGVRWLENGGSFPYREHRLISLPGAHRAVAVDLDGDGDLDIVATAFLPDNRFPERDALRLDSIIWLEQIDPGRFVPHVIENGHCDHATLDVADFNGDGLPDLITGNMTMDGLNGPAKLPTMPGWITVWESVRRQVHSEVP